MALETVFETAMPEKIVKDPSRLGQILLNLVGNAIKFTEVGSVKTIGRFVDGEQKSLEFLVVDTGLGIQTGNKSSCFFLSVFQKNKLPQPQLGFAYYPLLDFCSICATYDMRANSPFHTSYMRSISYDANYGPTEPSQRTGDVDLHKKFSE